MTTATATAPVSALANPATKLALEAVKTKLIGAESGCGFINWEFAATLLTFKQANRAVAQKDIADHLGKSESTVSKWLSAARVTPEKPTTVEAAVAFNRLFNGNGPATAKKSSPSTKADALRSLASWAKSARKLGATDAEIIAATKNPA